MDLSDESEGPARRVLLQRAEFVTAFTEHAGAKPASERLKASFPMLLTTTALIAAAAIVVGIFWRLLKPPTQTSASGAASRYTAVAGWDCTGTSDHGFAANGRTAQWLTVASGGWSQDGCRGTFETIPMTGNARTDDANQYAQWWFQPHGASQCQVSVYVPLGAGAADTGATAAHYAVLAGPGGSGYAEFVVNQSQSPGQWVNAGTFPVRATELVVRITDRGEPAHAGDRIAVSQLRVTCGS